MCKYKHALSLHKTFNDSSCGEDGMQLNFNQNVGCISSTCTRHCTWIEYITMQFKFELIVPFYSELIIISLAGIWTQDLPTQ